jgi:Secretion system C-terminal sorting domain
MTKDATDPNKWTATNITLTDHTGASDDGIKFRAEAAWAINWGAKEFPSGIGTANGPNIECKAGVYNVAFRSDTGEYGFAPASSTYDLLDPAAINIVPNPASEYVNINITEKLFKNDVVVKIMDNSGRMINKVSIYPHGTSKVDVSSLNAGRYFMIITDGQSTVAKSVIIVD